MHTETNIIEVKEFESKATDFDKAMLLSGVIKTISTQEWTKQSTSTQEQNQPSQSK